jgi:hypothetical protein
MKRFLPLLPVLAAVLAHGPAALAQGTLLDPVSPVRAPAAARRAEAPATEGRTSVREVNQQLVRDLTAILKNTKSADTFLVTVRALGDMGSRAKPAVPAIILNAERLGLLENILEQADDEEQLGPGIMITEAIADIVTPRRDRQPPSYAVPPPPCCPPCCPAPSLLLPPGGCPSTCPLPPCQPSAPPYRSAVSS